MPVVLLMAVGVVAVSMSAPLAAAMTVPALAVAFWRTALATATVLPVVRPPVPTPAERRTMVLAGLALALHFGMWIPSLRLTSVASATSLVCLTVVWILLWERLRGRRQPQAALAGVAVALLGTVVVAGVDVTVSARAVTGDALALGGGIAIAGYLMIGARIRETVRTTTYTAWVYGTCAAALLVACLVSGQALGGYPLKQWLLLGLLTLTAQLLGHSVFNHLLSTVAPSTISLVLLLEVPGASLLAAVFLGQAPPLATYAGLALILVGLVLVVRVTNPTGDGLPAATPK